ncbi:Phytochelatin-domain-containing protein [Choiromyces venosus 120613-1]|uniref:glutathione gamma-glutamylcysteinyltransferase n=1 Tax=Choiromyces venosus 120613-1 TaxID=1336337 RepID=A0A3N4JQS9_9PEZI|nr:Phytochelatin-domain-containing protein [Choiromyces venosus 120613-1]
MRELPKEHLIGYDTPQGKRLFAKALAEGGLEAFFPLSQQFLTQNEPAYCGIGTLCMILNALKVDPTVTWRKPWRWFTQEMLDCCQPLEVVKEKGITLAEFSCLAKCNGLDAITRFADSTSFEAFHEAVKVCTFSSDQLMAVSYSRASLGQTGAGHFSPVGGYTSENGGMVLILDVARFKYPSYWVPIGMLFESLIPKDPATNQPRGYSMLRRHRTDVFSPNPVGSLLRLNATKSTWPPLAKPLYKAGCSSSTYPTLLQTLTHHLSAIPTPVTSRSSEEPPNALPSLHCRNSHTLLANVENKLTYERHIDSFLAHLEAKSSMYAGLEGEFTRMEKAVFLLSLFGMQSFLGMLVPAVKKEVVEAVGRDLEDEWVYREVMGVRRQMESVEKCCWEEKECLCATAPRALR